MMVYLNRKQDHTVKKKKKDISSLLSWEDDLN